MNSRNPAYRYAVNVLRCPTDHAGIDPPAEITLITDWGQHVTR